MSPSVVGGMSLSTCKIPAYAAIWIAILSFQVVLAQAPRAFTITQATSMPEELRAVKITNVDSQVLFSDESIAEAMDYLAEVGINAILPVVQNGGYTQFYSDVMDEYFGIPLDPRLNGRDPLAVIVREARRVGIEVYPWFEYGFAAHYSGPNGPATGGFIGDKYPHWMSKDFNGDLCKRNGFDWLSGINPEVQEFMLKLVMEVVRNYDVDGVEFSDRMPALPKECGYDDATATLYRADHGGFSPPADYTNFAWNFWRIMMLNEFYEAVHDSVKSYDETLFVASSPNIYPWGRVEYLQDPVKWAEMGIIDHLIPQLYRTNISDYRFELNKTLNDLPADVRHIYFAGILMNVGSYLISPEFLGASIQANREKGVAGEAYFFYEGFRKNDNELGDYLRDNFYGNRALVPGRSGFERRYPALKMHEGLSSAPGWTSTETQTPFGELMVSDFGSDFRTQVTFAYGIEQIGWHDVYVWSVTGGGYADHMRIQAQSLSVGGHGQISINLENQGWNKVGTFWLGPVPAKGLNTSDWKDIAWAFEIIHPEEGHPLAISEFMAVPNRKIDPIVGSADSSEDIKHEIPVIFSLSQNYPNPFNPSTTIDMQIHEPAEVRLQVTDVLGRTVAALHEGFLGTGTHQWNWNASVHSSGIYLLKAETAGQTQVLKMMLVK